MIGRFWRGWATTESAGEDYETAYAPGGGAGGAEALRPGRDREASGA